MNRDPTAGDSELNPVWQIKHINKWAESYGLDHNWTGELNPPSFLQSWKVEGWAGPLAQRLISLNRKFQRWTLLGRGHWFKAIDWFWPGDWLHHIWLTINLDIQIIEISKVINREEHFIGEKLHITLLLYLKVFIYPHPNVNKNNVINATSNKNANTDLIYFKVKKHFWHL